MVKKEFNPWIAVLFMLIPILNLVLFYYWNKGIKEKWKLDIKPGLRTLGFIFVPISIVMVYFLLRDIKEHSGKIESPDPWLAILVLIPFVNIAILAYLAYKVQVALNKLNVKTL